MRVVAIQRPKEEVRDRNFIDWGSNLSLISERERIRSD
jgi:hypothetical protein